MVSVNTSKAAPLPMHRVRNCHLWPSDCRLRIFKCNKLVSLAFLLTLLSHKPTDLFGIKLELLNLPRFMIHFPTKSVTVQGLQAVTNYEFTLCAIVCIIFVNLWLFLSVIKQSGDVHPNPGPESLSSDSSFQSVLHDYLNIVHVNIQSLLPKLDILETEMQYYDIVVLTETWLSQNTTNYDVSIPNFDPPYRKDREDRLGGGVAIYIKSGIALHKQMNLIDGDIEALCVEMIVRGHKFLLAGFYRPPNSGREYWESIESTFDNLSNSVTNDLIILGDFNCDMQQLNTSNKMHDLALSYNLTQLIDEPTHYTEHSSSLIDLILVNKPENVLYSGVASSFVPDLVRFHCPTMLILKFRKLIEKGFKRHIWVYEKGNYDLFGNKLAQVNWDNAFSFDNINTIADTITEHIITAAKESIPNKTVFIRPNEPEWINSNIKRQIRQRKRLFRRAKRINSQYAWYKFRRKRNEVTENIRQAKRNYYDKLALDLQRLPSSCRSWYKTASKFLKYDSAQQNIPILEIENGLIESDQDKTEVLNDFFIQQSTINDFNASLPPFVPPIYSTLNNINITETEVLKAIKSLDINKASGPDLINPKLLKEGTNQLVYPFTKLFNLSLSLKIYPESWKKANVSAIYKKDSPTIPNNYRPISLLSIIGKLMERCIHNHLTQHLLDNNIITPFQSGFRNGDSTVNQLLFLYHEFSKTLDANKEIRVVFCDISKAFDRVWHRGLLFKLRSIGISGDLIDWFSNYLDNRQQRVCIKGFCSSWKKVPAGVPQGSILGPTLFLIYINDLVQNIDSNIRLFADDTSLYVIVEDPMSSATQLNTDLGKIFDWGQTWLVDFNPNKTESLLITRKHSNQFHPCLKMGNTDVKEVTQHKHLGLTISKDLKWNCHINQVSEKAWKRIGSLRRKKFILDRRTLNKLYITYIRPLLEYGDIIWDNCSLTNKRYIDTLQVEAARIVTGGTKLCSIHRLYRETGWETLQLRRNKHKLFQLYKIINSQTPEYLKSLLPPRMYELTEYALRNNNDFAIPVSRTAVFTNSFLPSALRDWNTLSLEVRNVSSLSLFKTRVNLGSARVIKPPSYYSNIQTSREGQIYHTRLRLECSSLNQQLFVKSIIDSPLCSCGLTETASHFLLSCVNYRNLRLRYFSNLPQPLSLSILLNGIPDAPIDVNEKIFKQVQQFILASKRF